MSADNWAMCPRCAKQPNPYYEELERTLEEYCEIGIFSDGEFFVSYHGRCTKCGLEKAFEHAEQVA